MVRGAFVADDDIVAVGIVAADVDIVAVVVVVMWRGDCVDCSCVRRFD